MKPLCLPVLAAFLVSAMLPTAALADNCRRVVTTYAAPSYTQTYAPTYSAPTYHQEYHNDYHQDTIVVSRAFRVLVDPEYYNYTTVTAEVRAAIYAELYRDKVARERAAIAAEEGLDPGPAPAPVGSASPKAPAAIPKATAPAPAPKTGAVLSTAAGISPQLRAVVKASCVTCHSDGANKINLDDANLAKLTVDQWGKIVREVSKNRMPKGKPPLADAEFQLFDAQLEKLEQLAKAK